MKIRMDKLKNRLKNNNKLIIFLVALVIFGVIAGTIFSLMINKSDKTLVANYLAEFIKTIDTNKINLIDIIKNSLFDNITLTLIIWLLGISIIGIPIILFAFFSKTFIIGFIVGSMIINYKIKGCLLALIYLFPHQIINTFLYLLLVLYSLALSFKLIFVLIKRKTIDFKPIMNKYVIVLGVSLLGFTLTALYEALIMPKLIKSIIPLL
ncbi:MAG: stage II sporulation protein M [Bacilli bacterium]